MIKPKLLWDSNLGEGNVKFPEGFDEQDWVVKADALSDWLYFLSEKYNSLMAKDCTEKS